MTSPALPVIDLERFRNGDPQTRQGVADQLFQACRDVGFAYLVNHLVPQAVVDEAFEWSARFFALPHASKMTAPHPRESWHHRGYSGPGLEKASLQATDSVARAAAKLSADVKETFELGREDDPVMTNVFPPESILPGFRAAWPRFFDACYDAELEVLRALALGLRLDAEHLVQFHRARDNQVRLAHYPAVPAALLEQGDTARIGAHTDFSSITMLFQDHVGGLEVEDPHQHGRFLPVPSMPGAIVLNVGDFLMRWSNDVLKSSLHRVRAPPVVDGDGPARGECRPRFSIPYFCSPDVTTVVDCLPGTWDADRPKRYAPICAKEYIDQRMAAILISS